MGTALRGLCPSAISHGNSLTCTMSFSCCPWEQPYMDYALQLSAMGTALHVLCPSANSYGNSLTCTMSFSCCPWEQLYMYYVLQLLAMGTAVTCTMSFSCCPWGQPYRYYVLQLLAMGTALHILCYCQNSWLRHRYRYCSCSHNRQWRLSCLIHQKVLSLIIYFLRTWKYFFHSCTLLHAKKMCAKSA